MQISFDASETIIHTLPTITKKKTCRTIPYTLTIEGHTRLTCISAKESVSQFRDRPRQLCIHCAVWMHRSEVHIVYMARPIPWQTAGSKNNPVCQRDESARNSHNPGFGMA